MGGLDVTGCCRFCLKDASSASAVRIDLQQEQVVADLVQELYGVNIKSTDRGSKYICLPCYRNAAGLKKFLDSHKTKASLVSVNQSILESQADAFLEDSDDDVEYCETWTGYRAPISSPVDMLLKLKDCMRSKRFREALNDQHELGHLHVSGPIYQKATGTIMDMWYPVQLYCMKCRRKFENRDNFDDHTISCKFKCIFCSRNYTHEESLQLHSCPRRDKHKKSKKRRFKVALPDHTVKQATITPSAMEEQQTAAAESSEQESMPIPDALPAPVEAPRIEGEASLDAELTNLLERWYGQGEEIEELRHLSVGAIDAPHDNGVFTNSELYSRIIDSSYLSNSAGLKPAISVKPMSQLVETPVEQLLPSTVPEMASTYNPHVDVIEIDDDDDVQVTQAVVPSTSAQVADKPEQALSEKDILNIVKHFRGIDENESYLVKAKINGAQKLICISKRKNEGGSQSSVVTTVVNNNSALQAGNRKVPQKQIVISPTVKQPAIIHSANTIVQPASTKPTLIVKNVSDINGGPIPSVASSSGGPQLKISHVQSLVSDFGLSPNSRTTNQQRILNGIPQYNVAGTTRTVNAVRKVPTASFTVRSAPPKPQPGGATKAAPQRIIVGSNSLKLVSGSGPSRFVPIAPKPIAGPSSPRTPTQQRIIVQRKQVQTIIQSSTMTRTSSEGSIQTTTTSSSTTDVNNSLLRSQLLQQPPKIYPSGSGTAQNGNRPIMPKSLDGLTGTTKQFKLNNTTIKRMN